MEITWRKLRDIAPRRFDEVSDNSGIYFLRWFKDWKPVSIGRLGGLDDEGILYVGSAENLKRRIRELWRGIDGKVEEDTIGKTIAFCQVSELIKLGEYEVSWEEIKPHKDAVGQEWAAIKSYTDEYKEPPPFNLGIRREFFGVWDLGKWDKSRWAYEPDEFVRFVIKGR